MVYYALSEYYRPLPEIDEWISMRVSMCYVKQWHSIHTKIRNLINLGAAKQQAISVGLSGKIVLADWQDLW